MKLTDVDPGVVALHARNVSFDVTDVPLYWIPNEPIASHVINALNLLLPEGERMFCATFAEVLPLIKDDKLREEMLGFIGQESMHAETHNKVLDDFLAAHGIDPAPFVDQAAYLFRKVLQPKSSHERQRYANRVEQLLFISALEHIFAFLGDWILNSPLDDLGADPNMLDLFRWHGAEEVEHRWAAHNVAEYFDAGYLRRAVMTPVASFGLLVLVLRGAKFLIHHDPDLPNHSYAGVLVRYMSASRRGALPTLSSFVKTIATCALPGYTPASVGNTAQAIAYLASSPGARAVAV